MLVYEENYYNNLYIFGLLELVFCLVFFINEFFEFFLYEWW